AARRDRRDARHPVGHGQVEAPLRDGEPARGPRGRRAAVDTSLAGADGMTDGDFDATARLWLQEGPSQLADRVLAAALDEIHVTRQRRVWGPARRIPPMVTLMRLAALAAVLVVAVAGFT